MKRAILIMLLVWMILLFSNCKKRLQPIPNHVYIEKAFSVSENKSVFFAKGNLQYQASTDTWRFAENQWDYVGNENQNISVSYSGWIDLFGWGTGNNPTNNSTSGSDYDNYKDWGDNTIYNGDGKVWYTLTKDEWVYVLNTRTTLSEIRYAQAIVNGINGIILLPDSWKNSYYGLSIGAGFSSNIISQSDWCAKFETNGAVFLPAAGNRIGMSVNDVGTFGFYWSATASGTIYAKMFGFRYALVNAGGDRNRTVGCSVRLVCSAD